MLVFTLGFDASAWYHIRRRLRADFRLLLWDLPGLGASTSFANGAYELERFAESLHLLTQRAEGPVVLVGHSIMPAPFTVPHSR